MDRKETDNTNSNKSKTQFIKYVYNPTIGLILITILQILNLERLNQTATKKSSKLPPKYPSLGFWRFMVLLPLWLSLVHLKRGVCELKMNMCVRIRFFWRFSGQSEWRAGDSDTSMVNFLKLGQKLSILDEHRHGDEFQEWQPMVPKAAHRWRSAQLLGITEPDYQGSLPLMLLLLFFI